jgi:hypothetical protein
VITNERGLFGNQAGVHYLSGSSTTPTVEFLRF